MMINESLSKRGVQTTITFPLAVYLEIIKRSETQGVSIGEIVRRAVNKDFKIKAIGER